MIPSHDTRSAAAPRDRTDHVEQSAAREPILGLLRLVARQMIQRWKDSNSIVIERTQATDAESD